MPAKGSGVTTLNKLWKRCRGDFYGCWHYGGASVRGKPRLYIIDPADGKAKILSGPRATATLKGVAIPEGGKCWMKCTHDDCVSPHCLATGTPAEFGAWVREAKVWCGSLRRMGATRVAVRARATTKLTIEDAREIRASSLSLSKEAAIRGVGKSQISRVRRNRAWKDLTPFTGLGAR